MEVEREMEVESQSQPGCSNTNKEDERMSKFLRRALIILSYTMMVIGGASSPLLSRLYFIHGGNRKWLSAFLQTGGFPLILLPLSLSYLHRRRQHQQPTTTTPKTYLITIRILLASAALGLLIGVDSFMYAYGLSYLPVSTSSILISAQLGFTALFAFLLVRQRFTAFSTNAIVLLSVGALMLGLDGGKDRPDGVSRKQYYMGFFMTLGAAALYGVVLPGVELVYARAKQAITYTLVMEMQLVMGLFATAFSTVGMIANKDFQVIPREAKEFELGEFKYYMVVVCTAITWQLFFLGSVGAIFYGSALLVGVIMAVLIPVTEVLAVFFFHETFSSTKGISLALSLWGFISFFYGEYKKNKRKITRVEVDSTLNNTQS